MAKANAIMAPDKFVYNMLSCALGLAVFRWLGFKIFVLTLTLSCNPPVMASNTSERKIKIKPYVEFSLTLADFPLDDGFP